MGSLIKKAIPAQFLGCRYLSLTLGSLLYFHVSLPALPSHKVPVNFAFENKAALLEIWSQRVRDNGGVHRWNTANDARNVFQEWTALLELHKNLRDPARRKIGKRLEKYVVASNITALAELGTTVPLPWNREADFDMALLGCVSMIGLYLDDKLLVTDTTLVHLIKKVIRCWGQNPKYYFRVLTFKFQETENHVFMIESARYLTNQIIWENKRGLPALDDLRDSLSRRGISVDNKDGVLRNLLLKQMRQILVKGLFEFNALIYQRFTLHALNNLHTFARDTLVAAGAGAALDYIATKFSFQSFQSLRLPPFRRNAERYKGGEAWVDDAAGSFFAAQSGLFPGSGGEGPVPYWRTSYIHSSVGLYSTLLKYRVPLLLLDFMQNERGTFLAKMETKHRVNFQLESTPEIYLLSKHFLLTAGGAYKFYRGPNFPISYVNYFTEKAPWVYDIISQSSSAFIPPLGKTPEGAIPDFLKFKGLHWKSSNLALYKNFVYGYGLSHSYEGEEWPQNLPGHWVFAEEVRFSLGPFEFRALDLSSQGVYVILSRIRPPKTWLKHDYQKYSRGTVEIVDTSWVEDFNSALSIKRSFSLEQAEKYRYPLTSGEVLQLNPRHNERHPGIKWIWDGEAKKKPYTKEKFPLLQVASLQPPWLDSTVTVALAPGDGTLEVTNSVLGAFLRVDYRSWWHPRRINSDTPE